MKISSIALCALLAFGCSGGAPEPIQSDAPFTFDGSRAKDLVLPVAVFPAGTYVREESAMATGEIGGWESFRESARLLEILANNGYIGGYGRSFEFENGGRVPDTRQVSVLLFRDSLAARSAVDALTEMRLRQGFSEYSLGTRVGDYSRFVGGYLDASDSPGSRLIAEFQVLYSYLNAVVLSFVLDDKDALPVNTSADFALMELRLLREAVARQTPKPS